jgi:hypothetical protein
LPVTKRLVFQVLDLLIGNHAVSPLNELILALVANNLQVVHPDHLPDHSQNELFVSFIDVSSSNAWNLKTNLLASLDDFLAVNSHLVGVIGLLINNLPVNAVRVKLVKDFQKSKSIHYLSGEVSNVHILKIETVDP